MKPWKRLFWLIFTRDLSLFIYCCWRYEIKISSKASYTYVFFIVEKQVTLLPPDAYCLVRIPGMKLIKNEYESDTQIFICF